MKINPGFDAGGLFLATAFLVALGFGTHASADSYLVDLNTRTATSLVGDVQASAINDTGQGVGSYASRAFIADPNGVGMRDLDTGIYSGARGINAAGEVAGYYYSAEQHFRAFITGPDGVGMRDLGTLGGTYSYANDINNAGQVVGFAVTSAGFDRAFITGPGGVGMRNLGTLGGEGRNSSRAFGINDAGQVVGRAETAEGLEHAFITGPDGKGHDGPQFGRETLNKSSDLR